MHDLKTNQSMTIPPVITFHLYSHGRISWKFRRKHNTRFKKFYVTLVELFQMCTPSFSRLLKPFIPSSQSQLSHLHLISCNSSRVVATCLKTMAIEKSLPRCVKTGPWTCVSENLDTTAFSCTWKVVGGGCLPNYPTHSESITCQKGNAIIS